MRLFVSKILVGSFALTTLSCASRNSQKESKAASNGTDESNEWIKSKIVIRGVEDPDFPFTAIP